MKGMLHEFNKGGLVILEATMAAYQDFGGVFHIWARDVAIWLCVLYLSERRGDIIVFYIWARDVAV